MSSARQTAPGSHPTLSTYRSNPAPRMKNSRINKRNVRYVRSPLYISFHPLSLSLSSRSFSIDVCATSSIALGTPFFFSSSFFSFSSPSPLLPSLFSTDKQCIVEMKIGCTAALRESLINFLIIRWSDFAIHAASKVERRLEERMEGGERERSWILVDVIDIFYCCKIPFVENYALVHHFD